MIRRVRGELGATGVDGLERDLDPRLEPSAADLGLVGAEEIGELTVGEAEALGPAPRSAIHRVESYRLEPGALVGDASDLIEEPRIDPRRLGDLLHRRAATQRRLDQEGAFRRGNRRLHDELVERQRVVRGLDGVGIQSEATGLERTEALLQ